MLLYALALLAPDPTPEALALGRRLAETGTLASLVPVMIAKDTAELESQYPDLTDAERAVFRAIAAEQAKAGTDRLMEATGMAYAETLSIEDLRSLVAFNEGDIAKRWRAATPGAIIAAMGAIGPSNFKDDTRKAFCAKTGKGCPAP